MADAVKGQGNVAPRDRAARAFLLSVLVGGASLVPAFMTQLGGMRGGELWAPLFFGGLMAVGGGGGWGKAPGQRAAVAATLVVGLVVGSWVSRVSTLSHGRLRAELSAIHLPASFHNYSVEDIGSSMCFDLCTAVERRWETDLSKAEAFSALSAALRHRGFVLLSADRDGDVVARRGRLCVTGGVGGGDDVEAVLHADTKEGCKGHQPIPVR